MGIILAPQFAPKEFPAIEFALNNLKATFDPFQQAEKEWINKETLTIFQPASSSL